MVSGDEQVLDRDALLEQAGGDPELVLRLIELFAEDRAETLDAIQEGMAAADAKRVERAAHRLKGSLGTLAARAAHAAALRLETIGRTGSLVDAGAAWVRLQSELARLQPALDRVMREGA
ncbi:MAG: Hpt domain-containing protein [bacterium]|nr:Hpt domain-containing protein [bacterium]